MKKRILFVNDEMTMGGVARILNNLLKSLDHNKYDVDLLVLHPHGELMSEIPAGINVIPSDPFFYSVDASFDQLRKSHDIPGIIRKGLFFLSMKTGLIKAIVRKKRHALIKKTYDVEFAAKEGFCTIFTAYGNTPCKLNWVQTDYKRNNYASHHIKLLSEALTNIDMNIACSAEVAAAFEDIFAVKRITIIRNMIDEEMIRKQAAQKMNLSCFRAGMVNIIAVARFHPQKGLDRLIEAIAYAKQHGQCFHLTLIGDGPLMDEIKHQTHDHKLDENVSFLGYQMNPYPFIKRADLFVLSSLYEGYPTIVIESLLSGTPVLAMKVAGVDQQITAPEHGWIIPNDQSSLNEALTDILKNEDQLRKMKLKLNEFHYDNEKILKKICYYIDNCDKEEI